MLSPAKTEADFSLVKAGPFWRVLQLRAFGGGRLVQAGVILGLIGWLPLLVLSALEGVLISGPAIPFDASFGTHVRFLLAIPLMFAAEVWFDDRTGPLLRELARAGVVRPEERKSFDRIQLRARQLVESVWAEILVVLLTVILLIAGVRADIPGSVSTWRHALGVHGLLTWAGWWYAFVSMPIFQFLLWRWCWRLLVWTRILWQTARLDLQLVPTHPDLAGGLAALGMTQVSLSPLLFGLSAMMVASYAEDVLFGGIALERLALPLTGVVVGGVVAVLAPLVLFSPRLLQVKERGILDYSALGTAYAQGFARKWIKPGTTDEPLLGSADIQSLADLANSVAVIRNMRIVPCSWQVVILLALASIIPMAPLLLIALPLDELIIRGVKTTLGL